MIFFLSVSKMLLHYVQWNVPRIVSNKKSVVILTFVLLYLTCPFSLSSLKIFNTSFKKFYNNVFWWSFLQVSCAYIFSQILKFFSHYFRKYFSDPYFRNSSFTYVKKLYIIPLLINNLFFSYFSFCVSSWISLFYFVFKFITLFFFNF